MQISQLDPRYEDRIARVPSNLVVQPTGFCNLACTYCYLPDKDDRTPMSLSVARAVARSAEDLVQPDQRKPLGVIWHAGEPLALGVGRFTELLQPFEELRRAGALEHAVQTNATLVDAAWCDLFTEYGFRVGVSIDGPSELAAHRVDRAGHSAHRLIMKGIKSLQDHGVPFSVLAVVGQETIGHAEALLDFLASLHGVNIGINIEEYEGANTERTPPTRDQAVAFWRSAISWTKHNPGAPPIRELDRLGRYLRMSRRQHADRRGRSRIDPLPTVAANGDVVLLSPELSGITAPIYDDFRAGNVLSKSIASMLAEASQLRYVREFLTGLDRCESTCEFFDYCRGSQAGNRYFEQGTFAESETNYCRVTDQAPVIALAGITREEQIP